ncbi:MAG: AraC family transcriptional regulator [Clostridiaceae bacterium]|nr:AraC family transcriptional regulator [Clostridiaceae bacterium]
MESEVRKNNINALKHIQQNIDTCFGELDTIAYQIYTNPKLTTYMISDNILNTRIGIKELKNYIIGNKFVDEVFVYYSSLDRLCSSSHYITVPEFANIHRNANLDPERFYQVINSADEKNIVTSIYKTQHIDGKKQIVYIVPDTTYKSNINKRTVFFLISEKSISGILKYYKGNTVIYDNNMQIVAALSYDEYLYSDDFQFMLKSIDSTKLSTIEINQTRYFISYIKSPTTKWTYLTLLPEDIAMKEVMTVKFTFINVQIILIIIMSIVVLYIMRLNYNPIRQLKSFAESKLGKTIDCNNEIEVVRMTIDHMSKTHEELSTKITSNKSAIKEFLLLNLLKGNYENITQFNDKARDIGISFTSSYFGVAIISFTHIDKHQYPDSSKIIYLLEENISNEIQGYGKDNIDNDKVIFVFSASSNDTRLVKEFFSIKQRLLLGHLGLQATIGISNIYKDTGNIGKSFIEASIAIDYRLIKGIDRIIFFGEIENQYSLINNYPVDELNILEMFIIEGDINKINNSIHKLINLIKETEMPLFAARCLCFDIINKILKTMCLINREFISLTKDYPDVMALAQFETVEELGEIVNRISLDICKHIKENREKHKEYLIDRLIAYIKENYSDNQFSIQRMADYFGMSQSNIGHYFKQATGQTISEYVNFLRIEKAKLLLTTKDWPLQEIITHIGYCDTSSFVRKFKKMVGTTPGTFRKIYETGKISP